jgi:hypothetical protein
MNAFELTRSWNYFEASLLDSERPGACLFAS